MGQYAAYSHPTEGHMSWYGKVGLRKPGPYHDYGYRSVPYRGGSTILRWGLEHVLTPEQAEQYRCYYL